MTIKSLLGVLSVAAAAFPILALGGYEKSAPTIQFDEPSPPVILAMDPSSKSDKPLAGTEAGGDDSMMKQESGAMSQESDMMKTDGDQ